MPTAMPAAQMATVSCPVMRIYTAENLDMELNYQTEMHAHAHAPHAHAHALSTALDGGGAVVAVRA